MNTTTNINTGVNSLSAKKTYRVVIANEGCSYTNTKFNKTLGGFTSEFDAIEAASMECHKIASELNKGEKVFYLETLNAWIIATASRRSMGGAWLITAKVEEYTPEPTPTPPSETETTTNTEDTMTTTDTTDNAPKFEELTHAATNIVLTAKNDGDIYRRYVEQLINSLAKKVAKGMQLNISTLASSGVVTNIIRESIKGMKSSGWTDTVTASDRKQAASYLASVYISDAIENAEYINA